jgi:hypothetical protein
VNPRDKTDKVASCNVPLRSVFSSHFSCGTIVSITYSECVSGALVSQRAKRMRRIVLLSVACPALPYFSTLCHE